MTTPTTRQPAEVIAGAEERESAEIFQPVTLGGHLQSYLAKIRGGDMGALPAVLGLVVLTILFAVLRDRFLTAINFANLLTQAAEVTVIAMGLVFVLLLGEIDLAAGFTSGVAAATLATLLEGSGAVPWYVAILAALGVGLGIGLTQGFLVAKVGIPSFVVTLAGFLAWQGVVLVIVGEGGTIRINDDVVNAIANDNVAPWLGWTLLAALVAGYAAIAVRQIRSRRARGLAADPLSVILLRIAALAVGGAIFVSVLNRQRSLTVFASVRGVPIVVPVVLGLLVVGSFVLSRTTYGRHVYATGGNTEAARRAGINVDLIRISVFALGSLFAAIGGIIGASRLASVSPQQGGGNTLLFAVGAAVIGGTSLFGGRGKLRDAVLGGLVIAVIANGMGLLQLSSGAQFVITGSVLLVAAGVDALSRRRGAQTGRR
ncbi:MAG TPA: ABC transporter permease [Frankiaceae bacterium]|nr:ABC transporter permease [Frankiaceae bacterium]